MGNYYVAYMLRLWMTEEAGKPAWRASLECPRTGDMLYFTSLNRLFQFLESGGEIPEKNDAPPPDAVDGGEQPEKPVIAKTAIHKKHKETKNER